jgi:hypothetical protein
VELSSHERRPIVLRWKVERPTPTLDVGVENAVKLPDGVKRVNGHADGEEEA